MTPTIRPARIDGKSCYICFLHPFQVTQLRTSTDTGQWLDIQKAAMSGGQVSDNPIWSQALGMYHDTLLMDNTRITQGVNSSTGAAVTAVRRAVFAGAQALTMGHGRKTDSGTQDNNFSWNEETFDYGNKLGVSAGSIFGMKKARYNSLDFATIVISSYSAGS